MTTLLRATLFKRFIDFSVGFTTTKRASVVPPSFTAYRSIHLGHVVPRSRRRIAILSEFYHLRRIAIKDVAAYIGFLTGFIGAAPFAWGLLSEQLASGTFVRGLWYFFAIVTAAGIFCGVAGLGLGHALGAVWEQIHRYRRKSKVERRSDSAATPRVTQTDLLSDTRPLQLVSSTLDPLPEVEGRKGVGTVA